MILITRVSHLTNNKINKKILNGIGKQQNDLTNKRLSEVGKQNELTDKKLTRLVKRTS